MAKPRVIRSVESSDGLRCIDIFRRDDGSYGFEEFRRDPEDRSGWRPIGGFGALRFADGEAAMQCGRQHLGWLSEVADA